MGRRKNFSREDVLTKAIPVFWKHGFADTKVEDLEEATGVNKSGLYSEFSSKEEIFVESLKHYLKERDGRVLLKEPLGWHNIRNFLKKSCPAGKEVGCFAIYSIRELSIVPDEAHKILAASRESLKNLIRQNLVADSVEDADELDSVILTFFTGVCLEQNLGRKRAGAIRQIDLFLKRLGYSAAADREADGDD
ncbi:MAG TPA: TetR/AcrR family transcriptional regulator [Planktothrix sp.]|jgi:AcrR family transcriptional regulator